MNNYIKHIKNNNYSVNTIKTYQNILKHYEPIFYDFRKIRSKLLKYSNSPNTMWLHFNVLKSYMKFIGDNRLKKLRMIKKPSIPTKYMPVFTKSFLINKTQNLSNYKNVVIRFLFETGMRISELKQIIKINKNTILIKGKGEKIREIFHNPETTKYFKGFNFSDKTLRIWVKQILGHEYTPHSIRRSHATHMLLKGINPKVVMLQLGHSKLETTYRYLQLSKENNQKLYYKYF